MREILFRGKTKDGRWVYGDLWNRPYAQNTICIVSFTEDTGTTGGLEVIPETVGQYTGLKDTNGVYIYEGDIVVEAGYIWFDEGKPNYRGTVEWIYSQWQVIAHCVNPDKRGISDGMNYGLNDECFDEGGNSDWEVIGNIHDNPEMMEVTE